MGEIAEAMLDGTFCAACGEYMGEGDGFPRYCSPACDPYVHTTSHDQPPYNAAGRHRCKDCGKKFRTPQGLEDHQRAKH